MNIKGWIGVDLDGTLAYYDKWRGTDHIGSPVESMRQIVLNHIKEGEIVKIYTARVHGDSLDVNGITLDQARQPIIDWCKEFLGHELEITCCKDLGMKFCYDDRCKQVFPNTGILVESLVAIKSCEVTLLHRIEA